MTSQDLEMFSARLVTLAELFDSKLSAGKIWLYFEALRDLPLDLVVTAVVTGAQRCTFMPKPAELRALAVGDDEQATERAWMACRTAMRVVGSYASLVVMDPALGETITAMFGSWPAACAAELSPEMWAAKRKEFSRVYRTLVNRGLVGARYLAGICEQQNSGRPDWLAYVPVKQLHGDAIETLTHEQADTARTQMAAVSHGFTRLGSGEVPKIEPDERKDSA